MRALRILGIFLILFLFYSFPARANCRLSVTTSDCVDYTWIYCTPDTPPVDVRKAADATGYSLGAGTGCADFGNGLQCYCCACNNTCGNNTVVQVPPDNGGNNNPIIPSTPPPAYKVGNYFQTKGGSVMTLSGGVVSYLPTGEVFSRNGDNGSPSIVNKKVDDLLIRFCL